MELAGVDAGEKMLGLAGEALATATAADDIIRRHADDQDRLQRSFPVFSLTFNSNFNPMNQSRRVSRTKHKGVLHHVWERQSW